MPKFHNRKSLLFGVVVGVILSVIGWTLVDDGKCLVGLFQIVTGLVLSIHCLDMLRYWKKHRIIRIVKTDTERLIYKENQKEKRLAN